MTPMIEAHGVTKRFGNVDALAGLDLVAESGVMSRRSWGRTAPGRRCSRCR